MMHYWYSRKMHEQLQWQEKLALSCKTILVLHDGQIATCCTDSDVHNLGWDDVRLVGVYETHEEKVVPASSASLR